MKQTLGLLSETPVINHPQLYRSNQSRASGIGIDFLLVNWVGFEREMKENEKARVDRLIDTGFLQITAPR